MTDVFLGRNEDVRLPVNVFLRHAICLGNAGSGKTVTCKVLCEEFIRQGIPVIALDPQGDVASLGHLADEAELAASNVPVEVRTSYAARAEVVVWTPASSLGVPLSVNPLAGIAGPGEGVSEEDVLRERGFAAESLADLIGFDLRSAEGRTVTTLFSLLIEHASEAGRPLDGVHALLRLIGAMPAELRDRVASVVDEKTVDEVVRRTRMLGMGTQGLLLTGGIPMSIDLLLGRGPGAAATPAGRTRLSIVYLNTLGTERERLFFVGQLAQALYRWMLKHPSPAPQVLFYLDEIAPYLPPVRKPVCKDALGLLFRQGRKYGVACLAATQSPGDVDYKALGQISTWGLGRLVVRQDVKKVEGQLKAIAPDAADAIVQKLPALTPGHSILFSPDVSKTPIELQTRWLVTRHKTLAESGIAAATDPDLRRRLEASVAAADDAAPGEEAPKPGEDSSAGPAVGRSEVAVLAVTSEGGVVNPCEIVVKRDGTGRITALGGQTKTVKESIKVAWEAASQLQIEWDLPRNFARRYDVTVLNTRMGMPKDGPSAGLAYLIGIIAAFRGTLPRRDVAMTGEITILGKVLAVGGIQEKVTAAYEAGYATVLVPAENRPDVALLPRELSQAIEVVPVATVQEAWGVISAPPRRPQPVPPAKPAPMSPAPPDASPAPAADKGKEARSEAPPPSAAPPPVDEQVRELLRKDPAAFSAAELAERLGVSEGGVSKALKALVQDKLAQQAKRGRQSVYYHAEHALRPEYGLLGPVEAVKLMVLEPEARKRAEAQIPSKFLLLKTADVVSQQLVYFPLYQVRLLATVREGWVPLMTTEVEKRDNLYFNGLSAELLSYQNGFVFAGEVAANPIDVVDLDNLAVFETRSPGDLPVDATEMNALVGEKAVEASALQKYKMKVLGISLVFLPVWRFVIRDRETKGDWGLNIDGLKGQPIVTVKAKVGGRKKK